jgi:hypothetical protein
MKRYQIRRGEKRVEFRFVELIELRRESIGGSADKRIPKQRQRDKDGKIEAILRLLRDFHLSHFNKHQILNCKLIFM